MIRRFRRHDIRPVQDLRGIWDFAFLGDVEPDAVEARSIAFNEWMAIPGCFDATPAFAGKRGLAAYRMRALVATAGRARLVFDGVHHWCRVLFDGAPLGEHVGGFTRFHFDIPDAAEGEHEIVVLVDNRFNGDRCPLHLRHMDWYHYGGIARGVELHSLGAVWIDAVEADTLDWKARRIRVRARATSVAETSAELVVRFGGQDMLRETIGLPAGATCIERTIEAPEAAPWSPGAPSLHELHIRLGEDDCRERIGIRQVRVEGREILLNDDPLLLLGFNRHEINPTMGHGFSDQQLVIDLQQLREMGCNFVRGSHYPQDERFLDLCDEAGLLVWCESIGWQHGVEDLTNERFIAAQVNNIEEMVRSARNHPCVFLWGILNESLSSDPRCRPAYETLLGRLRELDPSRPVTYASHVAESDVCLDLVDVISINTYPGWYRSSIEAIPGELDEIFASVEKAGHAEKPFLLSEIGAEALPGWRDWNGDRWTEDYQARLLEATIRHLFHTRNRVRGLGIWMFSDCRGSEEVGPMMRRARGYNNKGVMDEYRRPKRSFEMVRTLYRELRRVQGV